MLLSASLRVVSLQCFKGAQRQSEKTVSERICWKLLTNVVFPQRLLEIWWLPPMFWKFDAICLLTRFSSGLFPCLGSCPWLKLKVPKSFDCRNVLAVRRLADENEKRILLNAKWNSFLDFRAQSDFKIYQCCCVMKTTNFSLFYTLPRRWFFWMGFGCFCLCFLAKLVRPSRNFFSGSSSLRTW